MNYIPDSGDFISLSKLCEELSISTATGRNWIKLGRITPEYTAQKTAYFTKEYAEDLRNKLQSGHNQALKSRRNKNFISGNVIYASYISDDSINISVVQKLLTMISEEQLVLDSQIIQLLTADCALKLFADKHSGTNCRLNESAASLEHNLPGSLPAFLSLNTQDDLASSWDYYKLISALIPDLKYASTFCQKHPSIFELSYSYEEKEDVLGLIYLSCSNLGNRKAHGTYYTPTSVVRKLTSLIDFRNIKQNPCILDPCCGTGNFLLQLPEHLSFDCIYGSDLDTISVRLARINMALRYNATADQICEHIIVHNYLTPHSH